MIYQFISDLLFNIELWEQGADWRSWILHGLVGAALGLLAGPEVVFYVFGVREAEQFMHEVKNGVPLGEVDYIDHFMDVFVPGMLAGMLAAFFPIFR